MPDADADVERGVLGDRRQPQLAEVVVAPAPQAAFLPLDHTAVVCSRAQSG